MGGPIVGHFAGKFSKVASINLIAPARIHGRNKYIKAYF